jgi:hypothetical protein
MPSILCLHAVATQRAQKHKGLVQLRLLLLRSKARDQLITLVT